MVSAGDPSKSRKSMGERASDVSGMLTHKINGIRKMIQAERVVTVTEKVENNRKRLESYLSPLVSLIVSETDGLPIGSTAIGNMLSSRMENPLCVVSGQSIRSGDKDDANFQEVALPLCAKLQLVDKIPPYTTWSFLSRNQRMEGDQSVVGRRQIYYDREQGSEALIYADSEEEIGDPDEEKHEFSEAEDRILRMVVEEFEPAAEVLDILTQFIGGSTSEIQERCTILQKNNVDKCNDDLTRAGEVASDKGIDLDKSLNTSLDSLDNLFCRRCLVFDCRLHGYSQSLVQPSEKIVYSSEFEEEKKPCGDHCYLQLNKLTEHTAGGTFSRTERTTSEEEWESEVYVNTGSSGKRKIAKQTSSLPEGSILVSDQLQGCYKRQKKLFPPYTVDTAIESNKDGDSSHDRTDDHLEVGSSDGAGKFLNIVHFLDPQLRSLMHQAFLFGKRKIAKQTSSLPEGSILVSDQLQGCYKRQKKLFPPYTVDTAIESNKDGDSSHDRTDDHLEVGSSDGAEVARTSTKAKCLQALNLVEEQTEKMSRSCQWKTLEKELYLKGVEIFGRNRNLLAGLKTCIEVSKYMDDGESALPQRCLAGGSLFGDKEAGGDHEEGEMASRSRLLRKRGRTRKLKYSRKSAGYPGSWRRMADGKDELCRHYTPCECDSMCGKHCPCFDNKTCCEKYCGCAKSCKNRFRGCHCAKSQCRSRQCPCFAAGRECDPDVCRNCWVSCGDGSLGEPPRRGDGQCGNMRLLLRQHQRILLGKSDVAGWGAFSKNPVDKNDFLGEYTGELISHREADKRGKIYDRTNSSYLFDLDDHYVLDAYRKGDKLKFANHSANPNCFARVTLVAGDHRVGIFAKKAIEAGEELFYDYRYKPDSRPLWVRKLEGMKGDEGTSNQGRAKKRQSQQ